MKRSVLLIGLLCLVALTPLVCCDETILDEEVTLNAFASSESYFFNLTAGDTISIKLIVTGEGWIDFHIFNSTDGQLFDRYDIDTDGLQEQWNVPYSGRFEFMVELTFDSLWTEPTVGIKLTSAKSNDQPPSGQLDSSIFVDENVTITPPENPDYPYDSGKDFYINLTAGDRISMKVSATGSRVNLRIYNSTDRVYTKENFTSLNEEWTAPNNDTYDFWIFSLEGTSQVHITLQRSGGGVDPTILIIIVVVVAFAVGASVLILRRRKGSAAPPPPPPPPPSPP